MAFLVAILLFQRRIGLYLRAKWWQPKHTSYLVVVMGFVSSGNNQLVGLEPGTCVANSSCKYGSKAM